MVYLLGAMMYKRRLSSIAFLVLFLFPVFVQAFSVERDLGVGQFIAVYRDADTGWRIEGSFLVSRDIEFFICDVNNYTSWKNHDTVFLYEHNVESAGQTFNFTIPYNSTWYIVFSNTQAEVPINLEADIYYKDQSDTIQAQVSWIIQSTIWTPLSIGFLLLISAFCLLGVWMARRSEPFPAVNYDKILPRPD
ncbi:MAG: hypothetical protein ACFFF9_11585 [Candidatus Thorarchaeota archaeon]